MSDPIPDTFKAFRIHNDDDGYRAGIEDVSLDDLSDGDVTIRCHWSSVNYKDALAGTGKGKIATVFPITGGIDVSGVVVDSRNGRFQSLRVTITATGNDQLQALFASLKATGRVHMVL